jgi:hypothetical protein
MTKAEVPAPKAARRITEDRIKRAEGAFTTHAVTPYAGTTFKDLFDPAYWKHAARRFSPNDEIRAVPEDGSWYARLYVSYASINEVYVQELEYKQLDATDPSQTETEEYEAKWIAPPVRFGVIRKSDKEVIKSGFITREKAAEWMRENLRKKAA